MINAKTSPVKKPKVVIADQEEQETLRGARRQGVVKNQNLKELKDIPY